MMRAEAGILAIVEGGSGSASRLPVNNPLDVRHVELKADTGG